MRKAFMLAAAMLLAAGCQQDPVRTPSAAAPQFKVDPFWPKPLPSMQNGSVWDLVLSEDRAQRYIFIADGANNQMLVVDRGSGDVLSRFSRPGRMAGELKWVHNMAIDSKGNLYTAEVGTGRRAQKFVRVQ